MVCSVEYVNGVGEKGAGWCWMAKDYSEERVRKKERSPSSSTPASVRVQVENIEADAGHRFEKGAGEIARGCGWFNPLPFHSSIPQCHRTGSSPCPLPNPCPVQPHRPQAFFFDISSPTS